MLSCGSSSLRHTGGPSPSLRVSYAPDVKNRFMAALFFAARCQKNSGGPVGFGFTPGVPQPGGNGAAANSYAFHGPFPPDWSLVPSGIRGSRVAAARRQLQVLN